MKKIILSIAICGAMIIGLSAEKMSDNGKAGYTGSPGELVCTDCHNTYTLNTGGGSITLTSSNMTNWVYDPGVTYHMTATVSRSANSLFGVCVEALLSSNANAGTLVITNAAKTQIKTKTVSGVSRRSVVHTLDAGQGSGSYSFTFDWTAPTSNVGDVTFYFAGAATNANGDEFGDYIYNGSQVVSYNVSSGISDATKNSSLSVFPMPVVDQFNVNYELKSTGIVNVNLYNLQGALVSKLSSKIMSSGNHTDNYFLPAQLSKGSYILSIETESDVITKKILID